MYLSQNIDSASSINKYQDNNLQVVSPSNDNQKIKAKDDKGHTDKTQLNTEVLSKNYVTNKIDHFHEP